MQTNDSFVAEEKKRLKFFLSHWRACMQFDGAQFINSYSCYSTTSLSLSLIFLMTQSHRHAPWHLKSSNFSFQLTAISRNYSFFSPLFLDYDEKIFLLHQVLRRAVKRLIFIKFMKQSAFLRCSLESAGVSTQFLWLKEG